MKFTEKAVTDSKIKRSQVHKTNKIKNVCLKNCILICEILYWAYTSYGILVYSYGVVFTF